MLLESDILRLFFTGPYLVSSPLCSVSGVDCPSVDPRQLLLFASPLQPQLPFLLSSHQLPVCPTTNCPFSSPATNSHYRVQPPTASPGSRRQLSFASPYHFRVRRDFRSKNPLSCFAPKQTRLLWRPTPIVLHFFLGGGYQEQRKVCHTTCMCIPDSRYGLTLAWVTSENSTMLLESDILRLFFTGPYLVSSPLCSVSGVDCPSVDPRQPLCSPLSCPVSTAFSLLSSHQLSSPVQLPTASALLPPTVSPGSRRQLSFASLYHFRIQRDFMSKNPLSGFEPKQTRLPWRPTHIVLHFFFLLYFTLFFVGFGGLGLPCHLLCCLLFVYFILFSLIYFCFTFMDFLGLFFVSLTALGTSSLRLIVFPWGGWVHGSPVSRTGIEG